MTLRIFEGPPYESLGTLRNFEGPHLRIIRDPTIIKGFRVSLWKFPPLPPRGIKAWRQFQPTVFPLLLVAKVRDCPPAGFNLKLMAISADGIRIAPCCPHAGLLLEG